MRWFPGAQITPPPTAEVPRAGCQVGAGLTFGYLAARDAAGIGPAR
ncbi:MAG: hypothetical protein L0I76_00955 [Pseudonocardia sp.]|nr:hypothetical protein [Pseudonocardia sp.]